MITKAKKDKKAVKGKPSHSGQSCILCNTSLKPLNNDNNSFCQVIVLTDSTLEEQLRIGDFTHKNGKCLIVADTRGLFAQVFCDFGDRFTVFDDNGEQPLSVMVSAITKNVCYTSFSCKLCVCSASAVICVSVRFACSALRMQEFLAAWSNLNTTYASSGFAVYSDCLYH